MERSTVTVLLNSGGNFGVHGVPGLAPFSPYIAKLTSSPLSIQEYSNEVFSVFPNPVIKNTPFTVQVNLPDALQNEDLQLTVINSLGQRVDEFQISNSRFEIHAPREAGIYYLHLSAGSKWISGAKLVVE